MSTKPRTPEHFPRMKHRAAARIAKKQVAALPQFLEAVTTAANAVAESLRKAFQMATEAMNTTQQDYSLVGDPESES